MKRSFGGIWTSVSLELLCTQASDLDLNVWFSLQQEWETFATSFLFQEHRKTLSSKVA